ncbi:uncharacterized protein [Cardiocondyla obscurior]|uniref:uncharacterized protein n=1 Tax=Cardiocondyla obscurior TaxID=286306 RepID=UPI003965654F
MYKTRSYSIDNYKEYKNKQFKISNPRKRSYVGNGNDNNDEQSEDASKQTKQQNPLSVRNIFSHNYQQVADNLITFFVVQTMSPMDIVEHQAFKNLIYGISKMKNFVTVMTRKTLRSKINIQKSATLVYRRFKGTHSYDKIAKIIHDIHSDFKLDTKKVVKVTTDNASNKVKAFASYNQNNQINTDNDTCDNEDSDDDFVLHGITEGAISESNSIPEIFLSEHQRCMSHTLNLLVTVDIKDVLTRLSSGDRYSRFYHSTFGKCSAIWNLTSRSPKAVETYNAITGKASSSPCITRWNSTFDCLNNLIKVKEFLPSVCNALELPKFKDTDLKFLIEYIECLQSIAEALDRLQGEQNCFYGEFLPILLQTQKRLQKLQFRNLKYCTNLVVVLLHRSRCTGSVLRDPWGKGDKF